MVAFEPVPHFRAFLEYSVHLNGLGKLVDIRDNVVSSVSGVKTVMVIPAKGTWGTASVGGANANMHGERGSGPGYCGILLES